MTDDLGNYMRQLRHHPLLARGEEHALALKYRRTGRADLAHRLVEANLRLVVKIANEYRWSRQEPIDLVEQGNLGLVIAVGRFDPTRGARLATYAAFWIHAYILRYIIDNHRLVRVGRTQRQRLVMSRLSAEQRRGEDGLAARLGMAEEDLAVLASHLRSPELSLDARVTRHSDDPTPRVDLLASSTPLPDALAEASETQHALHEAVTEFQRHIPRRERDLLRRRWLGEEQVTLQDIGDRWGVSRERVRQIEARVLGQLKTFLEDRSLAA